VDTLTSLRADELGKLYNCFVNSKDSCLMLGNSVGVASGIAAMCVLEVSNIIAKRGDLITLGGNLLLGGRKLRAETCKQHLGVVNLGRCVVDSSVELGDLSIALVLSGRVKAVIFRLIRVHISGQFVKELYNSIDRCARVQLNLKRVQ
jgi:hypothetical protein